MDFERLVTVDLAGTNPGQVPFKASDEVRDFLRIEREFWSELAAYGSDATADGYLNETKKALEAASQSLARAERDHAPGSTWDHWVDDILATYRTRQTIHSRSTRGLYVKELAKSAPHLALRVAICLSEQRPILFQPGTDWVLWLRCGLIAEAFRNDWHLDGPPAQSGIEQIASHWEHRFADVLREQTGLLQRLKDRDVELGRLQERLDATIGSVSDSVDKAIVDVRADIDMHQSAVKADLSAANELIQSALATAKDEIETYKTAVKAEIAFKAPISFWESKHSVHRKRSRSTFWWFVAIGTVFVLGLTAALSFAIWYVHQNAIKFEYYFAAPFAVIVFFVVWVLRILSRQHLAHQALEADAAERIAMAQTFLALMEDPGKVLETDRILILSSLFRPSARADGDDGVPPNWFDLLMQRLSPPPGAKKP